MKKIISLFCMVSMLTCSISSISVCATEIEAPCTEVVEDPDVGLIYSCNLSASNYNGSLRVNSAMSAPSKMEAIGIKNLTLQYSYNGSKWYDEWNAGNFLAYDAHEHFLNYIMALERSGCYYRVVCTHYAKKSTLNTQTETHASNSVWFG